MDLDPSLDSEGNSGSFWWILVGLLLLWPHAEAHGLILSYRLLLLSHLAPPLCHCETDNSLPNLYSGNTRKGVRSAAGWLLPWENQTGCCSSSICGEGCAQDPWGSSLSAQVLTCIRITTALHSHRPRSHSVPFPVWCRDGRRLRKLSRTLMQYGRVKGPRAAGNHKSTTLFS